MILEKKKKAGTIVLTERLDGCASDFSMFCLLNVGSLKKERATRTLKDFINKFGKSPGEKFRRALESLTYMNTLIDFVNMISSDFGKSKLD